MDRFINKPRKFDEYSNTCQVVCLHGPIGAGKTTWAKENLEYIEVDEELLKSKDNTIEFINRIKNLPTHVLIDNYDGLTNLPGASFFMSPVTKWCTFLISNKPIEGVINREINVCKRPVLFHHLDDFTDPIHIVDRHLKTTIPRLELIDRIHSEHGNMMGYVHENYTSSNCSLDTLFNVIHSLSDASLIDSHMYDGNWELMPHFINSACAVPSHLLEGSVTENKQASFWTKHMNTCMRMKQFKESRLSLDVVDFMHRTGNKLKFYTLNKPNGRRRKSEHRKVSK